MNVITQIRKGKIDPHSSEKIQQYLNKNDGHEIEITVEVLDSPGHKLYRKYWGELLPDFADKYGDNKYKCHIMCKRDFLYKEITDIDMIPKKHLKNGCFMISYQDLMSLPDSIPYSIVKGSLIVHRYNTIVGYCQSTSKGCITLEDIEKYIKQVELRLHTEVCI